MSLDVQAHVLSSVLMAVIQVNLG